MGSSDSPEPEKPVACGQNRPAVDADQGSGKIINISSKAATHGNYGTVAYSAAKAGVIGLTHTMAKELAEYAITVNAVTPGYIRFTHVKTVIAPEQIEQMERDYVREQILERVGQPEDVAAMVAFLASDDAKRLPDRASLRRQWRCCVVGRLAR